MIVKIMSNTAASGVVLLEGAILNTPDDLSEADAKTLILHKRAVEVMEFRSTQEIQSIIESKEENIKPAISRRRNKK